MNPASIINRANQLNPNNWRYWTSRGYLGRPEDWLLIIGEYHIPGISWVKDSVNVQDVVIAVKAVKVLTASAKAIGVTGPGLVKVVGCACTIKGAAVVLAVGSVAAICVTQQEHLLENQNITDTVNATATVLKNSTGFIAEKSMNLANYSVKLVQEQGPNVWHYGAEVPLAAATTGLVYSSAGLKAFAKTIGYYCGTSEE